MIVTIELPPEMGDWVSRKLETKEFASVAEFIQSRLYQDWLEEKLDEALQEQATPLTPEDWTAARRQLEERLSQEQ